MTVPVGIIYADAAGLFIDVPKVDGSGSDRVALLPVAWVANEPTAREQASTAVTIRERARLALDVDRSFLALTSPTNAQLAAQVNALTRQNVALIRLVIGALDGTD